MRDALRMRDALPPCGAIARLLDRSMDSRCAGAAVRKPALIIAGATLICAGSARAQLLPESQPDEERTRTTPPAATGGEAEQAPPSPPKITPLKYTEDYSYLRDPKHGSGAWWEPFKFISLSPW